MRWKNFTWDLGHCTFPDTLVNFGVGGYLLVRLHKLNHESYDVAALYGSFWPKHVKVSALCQAQPA